MAHVHKAEKPSIWSNVHLLIHVHVQVNLGAQVKVEEGVHAEHEEQDCCDDQERILRRKQKFKNIFKMFLIFLPKSRVCLYTHECLLCLNVIAVFHNCCAYLFVLRLYLPSL